MTDNAPSPVSQYFQQRLKPQLAWYEMRAARAKRWRYGLASVQIVCTVAIPVFNVIVHSIALSSALAGVAALATSFESLFGHQDRWLGYRQTARALETVLLRYELGLSPYDGADRDERVISDAESVFESESGAWSAAVKQRAGGLAANVVVS